MSTRLLIVRHGNTFLSHETPTRVGKGTDLPLVETQKSEAVANWLRTNNVIPDAIFSSPLRRTLESARIIKKTLNLNVPILKDDRFIGIDYGPDENKTEDEVFRRLGSLSIGNPSNEIEILKKGKVVIERWNSSAEIPPGWIVNPLALKKSWQNFALHIESQFPGKNILVMTSNGIARFAPVLTGDFDEFSKKNSLKLRTGAIGLFEKLEDLDDWQSIFWNLSP